jgi:hypothetical protein
MKFNYSIAEKWYDDTTNVAEYQETPKNFKYLTDTPLTKALDEVEGYNYLSGYYDSPELLVTVRHWLL